jgi:hypothetical protein
MRFLYIPPEPQLRGQWIGEITDYVALFRNSSILVNPQVLASIAAAGLEISIEDDIASPHNNIGHYADHHFSDFSNFGMIGRSPSQPNYRYPVGSPYASY